VTLDEFATLVAARFPTAEQFLAFAAGVGWRVLAGTDGRPVLRVPDRADPLAVAFARLLSREPYRSNVLAAAGVPRVVTAESVAPEVAAPQPVPPETEPWPCRATCGRWFFAPRAEVREFYASPAFCDRPNCPQR
jgi:hypothetical protein